MNNYLAKGFFTIEKNSNQLISLPNYVKMVIRVIERLETYFVMAKNTAISSVANTKKKFHIHYDLHFINKKKFYHDKQDGIDIIFD